VEENMPSAASASGSGLPAPLITLRILAPNGVVTAVEKAGRK
jgi:hypothetical protein